MTQLLDDYMIVMHTHPCKHPLRHSFYIFFISLARANSETNIGTSMIVCSLKPVGYFITMNSMKTILCRQFFVASRLVETSGMIYQYACK